MVVVEVVFGSAAVALTLALAVALDDDYRSPLIMTHSPQLQCLLDFTLRSFCPFMYTVLSLCVRKSQPEGAYVSALVNSHQALINSRFIQPESPVPSLPSGGPKATGRIIYMGVSLT